jgi:hypothetical protein
MCSSGAVLSSGLQVSSDRPHILTSTSADAETIP